MLANVLSSAVIGIDAYLVEVEVDIASGLPAFTTVGLPEAAVKESKERVKAAINNSGYVSDATRAKVESAVAELGYVPKMLGPSLRFNQTNTLALVLTVITNPFWTTLARGAEDAAHLKVYSVIFCNTDESPEKQ